MDYYGAGFAKYNKRTQKFKHGSKLFLDNIGGHTLKCPIWS